MDAGDLIATVRELLDHGGRTARPFRPAAPVVEALADLRHGGDRDPRRRRRRGRRSRASPGSTRAAQNRSTRSRRDLREQFAGRTGLPLGAQVSVVKLLHLRDAGLDLAGLRWLNLPEYVVAALGGAEVSEYSLASRTGLLDQDTVRPWPEMLDHLGVGDVPSAVRRRRAPTSALRRPVAAAGLLGARLTVAGHDHLVSAVSGGAFPGDRYHVSMGTAEVLLRVLDEPLPFAARERLAELLINCVRHVVPGTHVSSPGSRPVCSCGAPCSCAG